VVPYVPCVPCSVVVSVCTVWCPTNHTCCCSRFVLHIRQRSQSQSSKLDLPSSYTSEVPSTAPSWGGYHQQRRPGPHMRHSIACSRIWLGPPINPTPSQLLMRRSTSHTCGPTRGWVLPRLPVWAVGALAHRMRHDACVKGVGRVVGTCCTPATTSDHQGAATTREQLSCT
jgi:hypothetical protein